MSFAANLIFVDEDVSSSSGDEDFMTSTQQSLINSKKRLLPNNVKMEPIKRKQSKELSNGNTAMAPINISDSDSEDEIVASTEDEIVASTVVELPKSPAVADVKKEVMTSTGCMHAEYLRPYCFQCGVTASIMTNEELSGKFKLMDQYLRFSNKERRLIKGDGHCLPRAVFTGGKLKDMIPEHINYISLFKAAIEFIYTHMDYFSNFLTESVESAKIDLKMYLEDRRYYAESNIIDAVIGALATVMSCSINIIYEYDGVIDTHLIPPIGRLANGVIEIALVSRHYDLVIRSLKPKVEIPIFSDPDYSNVNNVDAEILEEDKENSSEMANSRCKLSVIYQGKRRYISFAGDPEEPVAVEKVPDDIDGNKQFLVPINDSKGLSTMKGSRPWGKITTSYTTEHPKSIGPRLLCNCRGHYQCNNKNCPMVDDFGCNKTEFYKEEKNVRCKDCKEIARYVQCPARLIIEKDVASGIALVKHLGVHSCPFLSKGRQDENVIKETIKSFPRQSREGLIRCQIQKVLYVPGSSYENLVQVAETFTDKKFVENVKQKEAAERHPHGQSFEAIKNFQVRFSSEDPYLVYEYESDPSKRPFVMKSSRQKVQLLRFLDKDGDHRLAKEVVHLDVLHSRVRNWKTYTLSYYDSVLRQLVRLCTMEAMAEDQHYCTLFFSTINKMLTQFAREKDPNCGDVVFNPFHLKDDEHGGNKIGMANILGENFVSTRTSSCEYHFNLSVKAHKKNVRQSDREEYMKLCHELKDAQLKMVYDIKKGKLESLILRQAPGDANCLTKQLAFWDKCKYRWAASYRKNQGNIPKSSLAEASQASMTAAQEKDLSLAEAVVSDVTDSARLDSIWLAKKRGERNLGSGPSGVDLMEREEERQESVMSTFISNLESLNDDHNLSDVDVEPILDRKRSHRPDKSTSALDSSSDDDDVPPPHSAPKLSQVRCRSTSTKAFKKIREDAAKNIGKVSVESIALSHENVRICIQTTTSKEIVIIAKEMQCRCRKHHKNSRKKTCWHIVWCLRNIFNLGEDDPILAQVFIGDEIWMDLHRNAPSEVPPHLKNIVSTSRYLVPQLVNDPRVNDDQVWFLGKKKRGRSARCSGCLLPKMVSVGDLHLYVRGLLWDEKKKMMHHQNLLFCLKRRCVSNIRSAYNNIRPLDISLPLKKSPDLGILTPEEKANIQSEGFSIYGMDPINL